MDSVTNSTSTRSSSFSSSSSSSSPKSSTLPQALSFASRQSYLNDDRHIYTWLAFFGVPPIHYDRHTDRILCTVTARNWAIFVLVGNFCGAVYLFYTVQMRWFVNSSHFLSSVTDISRGVATMYAYEVLIVVAVLQRHRYARYFNYLSELDAQYGRPSDDIVRRQFWWHAVGLYGNWLLVSMPVGIYVNGDRRLDDSAYMVEYIIMGLVIGTVSVFLQYAAHCLQVRYACVRHCLLAAVGGYGGNNEVKCAMRMLSAMEEAKEQLNRGFGTILLAKLAIDGVNVILSVYLVICKIRGPDFEWIRFFDYAAYEWPFMLTNVFMVKVYQALGDEVSALGWICGTSSDDITFHH